MQSLARTIALPLILVTAACTGGGAEPVNDMGPGETQAAGQAITHASHSDARDFRLAGDAGAALAGGCSTSIPASPADADGDGIPDELTVVSYTGCSEGGMTFSGTQTIQDTDTSAAGFQFTSTWSIDATGTSGGDAIAYSYDAVIQATGGTAGTFSISDAAQIVISVSGDDFDGEIEDSHAWDVDFTPDDGAWSPAPGLPLEAGDLTLSGGYETTVDPAGGGAFALSGVVSTTTPLRTDPGCVTSIVSGEVELIVAEPEEGFLTVTWTGCGQTTAAFSALPGI